MTGDPREEVPAVNSKGIMSQILHQTQTNSVALVCTDTASFQTRSDALIAMFLAS